MAFSAAEPDIPFDRFPGRDPGAEMDKPLTGRVPAEAIRRTALPRLPQDVLAGFQSLEDLTGTVSDALDQLGLTGAVPASSLGPNLPTRRLEGQGVTGRH